MSSTAADSSSAEGSSAIQKTPAQRLQEEHESHNPTIEEVVDEEDIQHPPPSHNVSASVGDSSINGSNGIMSEKAAGKKKETPKSAGIDTQSEEAFPSLGPKPTAVKASGWGPKGVSPVKAPPSSSSGFPTPSSTPGTATPTSTAGRGAVRPAANRGPGPGVNLPGKYSDSFEIAIADIDKTKSIDKVLQDVRRKYKVNAKSEDAGFATRRRFVAEGPRQQVTDALLHISKEISVEQRIRIEVPSIVSASIIGKSGQNIRQLEKDYGVKIHIDRDQRPASAGPEDPRIDVVEIKGHTAASRLAHEKIANMVKQLQPKVDLPLRNIPPEFYPFIKGRHADQLQQLERERDVRIQVPHFHTWSQQPPPRPTAAGRPPAYVPHGDSHIIVSGEQAAAMQARQALEQLAERLQQELLLNELTCEQILHPYIVGDRGMDPLKFLEETGCAIILPPPHHETEDIHIIGPADRIDAGMELATKLMAQKQSRTVDLQKQFADAPMGSERHSRALAKYLQRKAIEEEFQNAHNAEIIFPPQASGQPTWTVVTDDATSAMKARNDLSRITQAFPASRLSLVDIDPFFHQHLEQMHAEKLRQSHGVHLIVPDNDDMDDAIILIYEGPEQDGPFTFPRARPADSEVKEFERALKEAQAQLLGSLPSQNIAADNFEVPRKFHDKVRRFVRNQQQPAMPSTFPVEVNYGASRATKGRKAQSGSADSVFLRGPSEEDIADLRRQIEQFLIEAEAEEKERGYTVSFPFPQNFTKNLIGKQGANIKALREKHDVDIDTRESGTIKIQGPQKKAEACKAEIIKLGKQFEDEVNYVIKVDSKFHGELIGKNGDNLTAIQRKTDNAVRIDFPKMARGADDQSVHDGGSETGRPTKQASDEIRIRGPRKEADKVREELLNLAQYVADNSHTTTVSVARDQIASLIGRGGQELESLRAETKAQIDIPNKKGEGEGDRVQITIKGTKDAVAKAKAKILQSSKEFDDTISKNITVDRKHHGTLIGTKGDNIRRIVKEAGGPEQSAEAVRFPRQGEQSDELTIRGKKDVVEKIIANIQAFVQEKDSSITESIDVPVEQHRNLIGANGNTRRQLEEKFKVSLDIPRRDSGKTLVKIAGQPSDVASAKEHISRLTKQPEGVTVQVPRAVHHIVSKNGQLFRELNRDGIKVDHSGQKPPPKPSTTGDTRSRTTNGAMPLITDQEDGQAYSWDVAQTTGSTNGEAGSIPWVLLGNKEVGEDALAKAVQQIESAIERAQVPKWTGYMILPDPRAHRHVIGKGGQTINKIRKNTGCDIQVPKGQQGDEAITIIGDENSVVEARDQIWYEVQRASEI